MLCFTERHVLLEVIFYLRVCVIGVHVCFAVLPSFKVAEKKLLKKIKFTFQAAENGSLFSLFKLKL